MSISSIIAASTPINEKKNLTNTAINTENDVNIIEEAEKHTEENTQNNNVNLSTKLTLENFKEELEKEYKKPFGRIHASIIEKHFSFILCSMSDEEKTAKVYDILNKFQTEPNLIKIFFESFKDKEKSKACAESIDFNTFKEINTFAQQEIVKHMSAPGTQKLFNEYKDDVYTFYHNHQNIIDKVYKNNLSEEERQKLIDSLPEDEKSVIKQYCELVQIGVNITQSTACNINLSQEEKEEFITQANNFFKELPSYNLFLEEMAKFISNDSNDLNIDKNKLTELLDKSSEGKFSEITQKLDKRNAVDENGNFKTASEEVITKSEEKIQAIKQSIEETSASEPIVVETKSKDETTNASDTDNISYETITSDDSADIIKDVFTGKIKVSKFLEQTVIKQYKLMDTAMQGNILFDASGKFFNDLIKNTKSSTLENLISIGWKGKSFYDTQKVKDEAEERKDDVA